jgi:hypothetical protein
MILLVEFVFGMANCVVIKLQGLRHARNASRFGRDQVKPTCPIRILRRDVIFRMKESSKQPSKLPCPTSQWHYLTTPPQQATKAATKEKTASICQDAYVSQSAPVTSEITSQCSFNISEQPNNSLLSAP